MDEKYRLRKSNWRVICASACCVLLAACGGDDGSGAADPASGELAAKNAPPIISGVPARTVQVNTSYEFAPSASDVDGDTLRFTIINTPSWAAFNSDSGRLNGRPLASDTGSYANIVISVSDGISTSSLPAFPIEVSTLPPQNSPPVIAGVPVTLVQAGQSYTFSPSATDPNGDTLSFSIANRPRWADFNIDTGELSGTSSASDLGEYDDISIMVSDGMDSASLPAFSIVVQAEPAFGSARISWVAPVRYRDGSPLTNIAGYQIYYGTRADDLTNTQTVNDSGATSATITGLAPGTWYFAVSAFDDLNAMSENSVVVAKSIT
jgi:hypothetical protein